MSCPINEVESDASDFEMGHRLDAVTVILKPLTGVVFCLPASGSPDPYQGFREFPDSTRNHPIHA